MDTVSLMARGPDELRSAGKTYWFCFITSLHEMACLVCCCPITDVHKSQEDSNKLSKFDNLQMKLFSKICNLYKKEKQIIFSGLMWF